MPLLLHELWVDADGLDTFCLAGPDGDGARAWLSPEARLVWTVEAGSHVEAMTRYHAFRGRGPYVPTLDLDSKPYPESGGAGKRPR